MVIDSRTGLRGVLVNADTGEPIRWARWANLETGEFSAFRSDPEAAKVAGLSLKPLLYRGRSRLRFVESHAPVLRTPSTAPPDVPPEQLTSRVIRKTEAYPNPFGIECDEPLCHERARWLVSDEQELPPVAKADGVICERAVTIGDRRYCNKHYRSPTFTTVRGVTQEVEVGVRPQ